MTHSPQQIAITFNRNDVSTWLTGFDVQLFQVGSNGTESPVFSAFNPPPELTDSTGTKLIIPIATANPFNGAQTPFSLQPGNYQIDLLANSLLSFAASGMFDGVTPLWDPTANYEVGSFSILGQGATTASAIDLGLLGSNVLHVAGQLTPSNYQQAVDVYKFTLPQGHSDYQVGLNVLSGAIGSTLKPALSLFDQNGNLIATRNAGTGTQQDPTDPYLFTGLAPGTYYVGVSGAGNLPNLPGGYDLATGTPGVSGIAQPGGPFPFVLLANAVPHDQPAQVTSFHVDYLDPLGSSPTSITMSFSAAINLSNVFVVDAQQHALELVDSQGKVWPTTAESYTTSTATLQLIVDEPLPAGNYTLVAPSQGGLVDLTGEPVGRPGFASGVLGSFAVAPARPTPSGDLGVLWPSVAAKVWPSAAESFVERTNLAPHSTMTYRFVVTIPGDYAFQTMVAGSPVGISLFAQGTGTQPGSPSLGLSSQYVNLQPGAYEIRFTNPGASPASIQWVLKYVTIDWEKIVDNGVGQNQALSLGLVSPEGAGASQGLSASFSLSSASAAFAGGSFASAPLPSTLFSSSSSPLGSISSSSSALVVVGPATESTTIALADAGRLTPGARYASSSELAAFESEVGSGDSASNFSAPMATEVVAMAPLDSETTELRADTRALDTAAWPAAFAEMLTGMTPLVPVAMTEPSATQSLVLAPESTPGRGSQLAAEIPVIAPESPRTADVDPASVGTLILVGAALYNTHRTLTQRRTETSNRPAGNPPTQVPAPHTSLTRVPPTRVHRSEPFQSQTRK